jgi:hypothetical protein
MTGGWDIFSNEFLIHKSYDNLNLLRGLVKWSFGQSGILKAGELIHKRVIIFKYTFNRLDQQRHSPKIISFRRTVIFLLKFGYGTLIKKDGYHSRPLKTI